MFLVLIKLESKSMKARMFLRWIEFEFEVCVFFEFLCFWINFQIPFATKPGHLIVPNFGLGFSIGKCPHRQLWQFHRLFFRITPTDFPLPLFSHFSSCFVIKHWKCCMDVTVFCLLHVGFVFKVLWKSWSFIKFVWFQICRCCCNFPAGKRKRS